MAKSRERVGRAPMRLLGPLALGLGLLVGGAGIAVANEWQGNYAWQFYTPAQRATSAAIADMMERRRAGGYGPASLVQNYYLGPQIAGDLVNCDISATATGNAGTTAVTGASSSPALTNQPTVLAQTTGNSSSGLQTGGSGSAVQDNYRSSLSSGVSGTQTTLSSGWLDASGGTLNQVLNSAQSNTDSPQTATVSSSNACYFVGR